MKIQLVEVYDDYDPRIDVYCDETLVGFVAWRYDHPTPGWYFQGRDSLGYDADGGVYFWWLSPFQDAKQSALSKFKRRFYLTFRGTYL